MNPHLLVFIFFIILVILTIINYEWKLMNKERVVELLKELVQIDSESGEEREIADYLFSLFDELELKGFEDDTQEKTGYGAGNLFFTLEGNENIEPICFMVHMDTVKPG